MVLVPEVVKQRWYQHLLHAHRARQLRRQLLRHGGPSITVVSVPWQLDEVPEPSRRTMLRKPLTLVPKDTSDKQSAAEWSKM